MVAMYKAGERRFPRTEEERKLRTSLPSRGAGLQMQMDHLVEVYGKDKNLARLEAAAAGIPISEVALHFGMKKGRKKEKDGRSPKKNQSRQAASPQLAAS